MTDHIPAEIRRQVVRDAGFRCGYCQSDQSLSGLPLSVEHIIPRALGGESVVGNLWLSCRACNEYKGVRVDGEDPDSGERVALFNPRTEMERSFCLARGWHDYHRLDTNGSGDCCYPSSESIALGPSAPKVGVRGLASTARQ